MNKYYPGEPVNIFIQSLINIILEKNWVITTDKGKGKLPILFGNGEQVIFVYACVFVVNFSLIFAMPNFKGSRKRDQRTFDGKRKYQHYKSYIAPTTTTIDPNDNINQNNQIFGDIHISSIIRCNYINSDNCAQNVYNYFLK